MAALPDSAPTSSPERAAQPAQTPWQTRAADPALTRFVQAHLDCPSPVAHLLVTRGLSTPSDLRTFLEPTLEDLHAPALMLGMDLAVHRIQQALASSEPILIYGDYDVDGTIATVLLKTAIERTAPPGRPAHVSWHVPHRIREGYGIRTSRLAEAAAAGVRLVISVDTGIRAFDAAREAHALGLDLIVTDHHLTDDAAGLPDALAVLNPAQPDCCYPFKGLCGAAVAFKLAHALLLAHATAGPDPARDLDRLHRALLPSFLKLVAIATIADSVPLVGENRTLAALGLRELANPVQPGLRALLRVADLPLDRSPTAVEVGFRIAPRINAAGRMDIADDVIELFLTRSPERAQALASKLNDLNEDRRATERTALTAIEARLAATRDPITGFAPETIVLDDPAWHRGVLGILASRIVDRTGRPALVLTHEAQNEEAQPPEQQDHESRSREPLAHDAQPLTLQESPAKQPATQAHGSGRSVLGFHLLDALTAVHAAECPVVPAGQLFTRFGGHAHAVGFSLPSSSVALLRERLRDYSAARLTAEILTPPLVADLLVPRDQLSLELNRWLQRCAPFGNGHPEPVLLTRGLTLTAPPRLIQERHLCLTFAASSGQPALQGMAWSRSTDPAAAWPARLGALGIGAGSTLDLLYRLTAKSNSWFSGLELEIIDLRPA